MDYHRLKFYMDKNAAELFGLTLQEGADWFNNTMVTRPKSYFLTERTLMALFGLEASTTIMETLKSMGVAAPALGRLYTMLATSGLEQGIDVGHPTARASIPSLVNLSILTQEQADIILGLGQETVSYATSVDLGVVLPGHILKAGAIN